MFPHVFWCIFGNEVEGKFREKVVRPLFSFIFNQIDWNCLKNTISQKPHGCPTMASGTNSNSAEASNMTGASTETTIAAAAPWESGASSSLDRAGGSAEDPLVQMSAAEAAGSTRYALPGLNATVDVPRGKATTTTEVTSPSSSNKPSGTDDRAPHNQPPNDAQSTVATANIKYRNQAGRAAILAVSTAVHHDFGALTSILNVTLPADAITDLKRNPNVEWVDGNGAVYFVQPWKY